MTQDKSWREYEIVYLDEQNEDHLVMRAGEVPRVGELLQADRDHIYEVKRVVHDLSDDSVVRIHVIRSEEFGEHGLPLQ